MPSFFMLTAPRRHPFNIFFIVQFLYFDLAFFVYYKQARYKEEILRRGDIFLSSEEIEKKFNNFIILTIS